MRMAPNAKCQRVLVLAARLYIVFAAVQPVECPVDIVFVLDESGSIGSTNFELMKSFVSQIVGRLDVDSGSTRVGLATYSTSIGTVIDLNDHNTVAAFQAAVSSLVYASGSTNTDRALAFVRTSMLTSAAGDRGDVPNIVVVFTDGQSSNTAATRVSWSQIPLRYKPNSITLASSELAPNMFEASSCQIPLH